MKKWFVCVSQGVEIFRTTSQEQAISYVKKENAKWYKYVGKCLDKGEKPAYNYIELEIEYIIGG